MSTRRGNQPEASLQDIQNSINALATNTNNAIGDLANQVQALAAAASAQQQNQQALQQQVQQMAQQQQQPANQPATTVTFATTPGTSRELAI